MINTILLHDQSVLVYYYLHFYLAIQNKVFVIYEIEKCVLDKWFSLVLTSRNIIAENAAIVFEVN